MTEEVGKNFDRVFLNQLLSLKLISYIDLSFASQANFYFYRTRKTPFIKVNFCKDAIPLMMIGKIFQNGGSPIELFKQDHPGHLMGEGHRA